MSNTLEIMSSLAREAGDAILAIYGEDDFGIETKDDASPLTRADLAAHKILVNGLTAALPEIPVLSEESGGITWAQRRSWQTYFLVDPLDGTKEFIKKNDEFTVNIALIENNSPVLGVIYAPVLDILYYGLLGEGAYRCNEASKKIDNFDELTAASRKLPIAIDKEYFGVVASRSHMSEETMSFIESLRNKHQNIEIVSKGSSLKLCMIAEGIADIYPRFAPTSEWDTAAGHAIVNSMGGKVIQADNKENDIVYNKENPLIIDKDLIINIFGHPKNIEKITHPKSCIGFTNGLYTSGNEIGGILSIQVVKNNYGNKDNFMIEITGNLKKVMKESVKYAFNCAMNIVSEKQKKTFFYKTC